MNYACLPVHLNPVLPPTFKIYIPPLSGHKKGRLSECQTGEALQLMCKLGSKVRELRVPPITKFESAHNRPSLEKKGIDFLVTLEGDVEVPIQVKSSTRGAHKFERKHRLREIRSWFTMLTEALVIEPYEDIRVTIRKISNYLNRAFKQIRRQRDKIIHKMRSSPQQHRKGYKKQFRFMSINCSLGCTSVRC